MTKQETLLRTRSYKSLMGRDERDYLWEISMKHITEGGLAIEIGTWKGASAVILAEVCKQKNARLMCIDLFSSDLHGDDEWVGVDPDFMSLALNALKGYPVHFLAGESQKIAKYLQDNMADFIFVDGDHHLPGVKVDIEEYWNKVKKGGMYCGHDYAIGSEVKEVVDNFLGKIDLFGTVWSKLK